MNPVETLYECQFEIYDFTTNAMYFAHTFERAVRLMRQHYDAKITRTSDNVVVAQTQGEGGASIQRGVQDLKAPVTVYEVPAEPPQDYRIFNKRQPDGTYRPLSEFFDAPFSAREEAAEAPFAYDAPIVPELSHAPEVDTEEFLAQGDYVHVQPHYMKKPYFAYVEAIVGDRVVVSHWSYGYVCDHHISEVTLKLKAASL